MEDITREMFEAGRERRFGTANPELMRVPFWEAMIRGGKPPNDPEWLALKCRAESRSEKPYQGYGPYEIRKRFDVPSPDKAGPIWMFARLGDTETRLPDGRLVCVGGEYEDWYDPDFCIYNDVVVFEPDGTFRIYGYPREVFPPTDGHTATLIDDQIILIGGRRYVQDRVTGTCTVYALDTNTFRMVRLEIGGDGPGEIYHHAADLSENGIRVSGGSISRSTSGGPTWLRNRDIHVLDLQARRWIRIDHLSGWRTFGIYRKEFSDFCEGKTDGYDPSWLTGFESVSLVSDAHQAVRRLVFDDVMVEVQREPSCCRVRFEGELPPERVNLLMTELVRQIESELGGACSVEET